MTRLHQEGLDTPGYLPKVAPGLHDTFPPALQVWRQLVHGTPWTGQPKGKQHDASCLLSEKSTEMPRLVWKSPLTDMTTTAMLQTKKRLVLYPIGKVWPSLGQPNLNAAVMNAAKLQ